MIGRKFVFLLVSFCFLTGLAFVIYQKNYTLSDDEIGKTNQDIVNSKNLQDKSMELTEQALANPLKMLPNPNNPVTTTIQDFKKPETDSEFNQVLTEIDNLDTLNSGQDFSDSNLNEISLSN
ncbi:MAG: hypothetical protein OHK0017_10460 [Patescibacteria group bacterium]